MKLKKYIPNILSGSRLLSPAILTPLILTGNYLGAIIALSCFLLTDAFDGYLARKWNVQSDLGAKIDAVADKTILFSLLIPLIVMNPLFIITLSMEGVISGINVIRKKRGFNPKTVPVGKVKMILISLMMGLNYLQLVVPISSLITSFVYFITTFFQCITANEYYEKLKQEIKMEKLNLYINTLKKTQSKSNNDSLENKKEISKKEELLKLREEILSSQELFNNKEKVKSYKK